MTIIGRPRTRFGPLQPPGKDIAECTVPQVGDLCRICGSLPVTTLGLTTCDRCGHGHGVSYEAPRKRLPWRSSRKGQVWNFEPPDCADRRRVAQDARATAEGCARSSTGQDE